MAGWRRQDVAEKFGARNLSDDGAGTRDSAVRLLGGGSPRSEASLGSARGRVTQPASRPSLARAMPKFRKIVILGYPSVGKSSLAVQFIQGKFSEDYEPTIENRFNKTFMVGEDEFQMTVIDTAGLDEYSLLSPAFVLSIHGYVLVYSVASQKSFNIAKAIFSKLQDRRGKHLMPIVLVANKIDIPYDSREVHTEEGQKLAQAWGVAFMEASAKDPQQSNQIFTKIIEEIDRVERSFCEEKKCVTM